MLGPQPSFGGQDKTSAGGDAAARAAPRRLSSTAENNKETVPSQATAQKQLNNYTELLDIRILKDCRSKFLEFGVGESGDALKVEDFIEILSAYMPRQDVEKIYKKIDVNDDGFVDWHEFTGFLINADAMKGSSAYGPSYQPTERAAQPQDRHTHRDLVEHLVFSMRPVPMIISGCKDGTISMWNYSDLSFMGSVFHHDKSSIMVSSMIKSISTAQKAAMKVAVGKLSASSPAGGVCITAMASLSSTGHLCVASADCSMAVYDLATQELCGRLHNTVEMVTSLTAFQVIDKRLDVLVPYIITGDLLGRISAIKLDPEFCASSDGGQKKKNQLIMEKALDVGLNRIKMHSDSITKLVFLPELEQIISASMDGKIKFINLEKMTIYREFNGHTTTGASVHVGVKSIAWAPVQKYIVSVGTDRVILMWDPYTLDIMCKLTGLSSPVMELAIDEKHQQVIASTKKKSIRCWDSITYEALEPVEDHSDYLPINEISCSLYVPEMRGLVTAANRLKLYSVEKMAEEGGAVEQDDLTCVLFNDVFHQVVIVSNSGKVKVYLSEDGSLVTHFNAQTVAGEDKSLEQDLAAFVKDAAFDEPKRRLIIITMSNEIQLWNCHNGTNLCMVTPRVPPYLQSHLTTAAGTGGSSLNIISFLHAAVLFPVTQQGSGASTRAVTKKHVLLGLQNGVILGLHESDELSEDATVLLIRSTTTNAKSIARKEGILDGASMSELEGSDGKSRIGQKAKYQRQSSVAPRHNSAAVLWMRMSDSDDSFLFAGYNDGIVLIWDVASTTVLMHMEADSPGSSFSCMRRRIITSRSRAPPMTFFLEQQRQLARQRSGGDDLKLLKKAKNAIDEREASSNAPEDMTHYNYSFMAVEESMVPTESAVFAAGSLSFAGVHNSVESKPLSLRTKSMPFDRPKSALLSRTVSNSLVKANSPFGFHSFSRGSVVGVGNRKPSTSEAGIKTVASTSEKLPMSPILSRVGSISREMNVLEVAEMENSYYSSQKGTLPRFPCIEQSDSEGSSPTPTHTQSYENSASTSRINSPAIGSFRQPKTQDSMEAWKMKYESKEHHTIPYLPVSVYHSVLSLTYKLMFGACSDNLLRIWDLESGEVLCSCDLVHSASEIKSIRQKSGNEHFQHDDSESCISKLSISEKSNHLVGGYDDGLVRVWLMGPHSTGQVRTVTVTDGGELAIPPLQYHTEWLAQDTAISGVEIICRDGSSSGISSYLCTSGQAQGVYLWTMAGKLVGTFGLSEWLLHDALTWKPKVVDAFEIKSYPKKSRARKAAGTLSSSVGGSVDSATPEYEWGQKLSRGLKLSLYMEKLKTRIQNRQATSTYAMQDGHFSEVQGRHPMLTPVPPAAGHARSPNNRSGRTHRQLSSDLNGDGNTYGAATRRGNKASNTVAGKLHLALTASGDATLQSLTIKDTKVPTTNPVGIPLEKLNSTLPTRRYSISQHGSPPNSHRGTHNPGKPAPTTASQSHGSSTSSGAAYAESFKQ